MATTNYLSYAGLQKYDELIKSYISDADEAAIATLDVTEFALGSKNGTTNVITLKGIKEEDGKIAAGSTAANDIVFAAVAATGAAANVSIADAGSLITATNVEDALQELAAASAGGVASKTIWGHDESSGQSDYAKVYKIYQGENDYVKDRTDGKANPELKLTINIPKDKVLEDAEIVNITFSDNKLWDGVTDVTALIVGSETPTAADAGKYLKMEMQNVTDPLYVNLQTFVDVYTVASGATEVQLALNDHEFSASIVDVNGSKVTYIAESYPQVQSGDTFDAEATYYTKSGDTYTEDSTVTADNFATKVAAGLYTHVARESVNSALARLDVAAGDVDTKIATAIATLDASVSQTAGADGLALSLTEVDGVVTAISGSIAANTYDAYGTAASAIAALDATESQTAGTDGLALSITEVDGVITSISGSIAANTYDAYGAASAVVGQSGDTASDNTVYGAKAYADSLTGAIPDSDIEALFD